MNDKRIIQRKLPLNVKYVCTDKKYIPLLDGYGIGCDNCGKLIANIAEVKSVNGVYNIGFDCLETFLLNNNLLENFDINEYEQVKKWISQMLRVSKQIKEALKANENKNVKIVGLSFEQPSTTYKTDFYTFYWETDKNVKSRYNDYLKLKNMDFNFMINTLRNIFTNIDITVI